MPKNILPSAATEMIIISFSGSLVVEMDEGMSIATDSGALNFVASIKKVRSRKAMSHMAVISKEMLFLGILTLGIYLFLVSGERLCNAKTHFVNIVCQGIDFAGKIIVGDDGQRRSGNT